MDNLGCQNLQATLGVSEDSDSSVHTPVALMTLARTFRRSPVSKSASSAPITRPDVAPGEADNLGAGCSQCAEACSGADDVDDEASSTRACQN